METGLGLHGSPVQFKAPYLSPVSPLGIDDLAVGLGGRKAKAAGMPSLAGISDGSISDFSKGISTILPLPQWRLFIFLLKSS